MKKTIILVLIVVVLAGVAIAALMRRPVSQQHSENAAHSNEHSSSAKQIPAHYETEPSRNNLAPTLEPAKFTGRQRDAYQAVREIPELIAQLPCYCHCDRGFGHKSLQSCYVDDHAAHCAVCVDEVLVAYELKKSGLSAEQIRERIIAQFGG